MGAVPQGTPKEKDAVQGRQRSKCVELRTQVPML